MTFMMAALFFIYLLCLVLILLKKENFTFTLVVINLVFSYLMLLHHATDILKIRL